MPDRRDIANPPTVYLNGDLCTAAEARLPIADQGVLFGFGFFESFRTSGGRPHRWDLHQRRLKQACATAGLELPATLLVHDESRLTAVIQTFLRNRGVSDAAFRYTITAGELGGAPNEFLTMRPLPPAAEADGICLRVLNLARDSGEWLPRPKSLNYLNALLGARELSRRSPVPSDEGLFLSRGTGCVVETTRQNVAWIRDSRICYPDPSVGALAGTGLAWMLELDGDAGPCQASLEEFLKAEAIFVINSVRGITPVREVSGQDEGVLRPGLASHVHPLVVSLRRQWVEALEKTARG